MSYYCSLRKLNKIKLMQYIYSETKQVLLAIGAAKETACRQARLHVSQILDHLFLDRKNASRPRFSKRNWEKMLVLV